MSHNGATVGWLEAYCGIDYAAIIPFIAAFWASRDRMSILGGIRSYRNAAQRVSMSGRTVIEAHFFRAAVLMSRRNLTLRESGCLVVEFRGWRSLYHAKYNRDQGLGPIERGSRSDSQLDIDSV